MPLTAVWIIEKRHRGRWRAMAVVWSRRAAQFALAQYFAGEARARRYHPDRRAPVLVSKRRTYPETPE